MSGVVHGVGLGPGAEDLMSLRAHRLLTGARHVAYFRKAGRMGRARKIVDGLLPEGVTEFPMDYPVTTEIPLSDPRYNQLLSAFYEECATHLRALAEQGEEVVVLCEGDPFFYGSFMHLYTRLKTDVDVRVVPGITGMSAAWTATGAPITWGDDVLTVLMGTLDEDTLKARMAECDALVVMKIGRHFKKVCRCLETAGLLDRAMIVEYAAMAEERVTAVTEFEGDKLPYFSIIVVHGQGRRP